MPILTYDLARSEIKEHGVWVQHFCDCSRPDSAATFARRDIDIMDDHGRRKIPAALRAFRGGAVRLPHLDLSPLEVAGQMALQRMPCFTKSAATDLITPMMLKAVQDMLMIEPPPFSIIDGKIAFAIRHIALTFMLSEWSH